MNLMIMTLVAVMVGLTTLGALTWAYFAEERACRTATSSKPSEPAEQSELANVAREVREPERISA